MQPIWQCTGFRYLLLFLLAAVPRVAYGLIVMGHPGAGYKGDEMERAGVYLVLQGEITNLYSDTSGPSAHVSPLYAYFLSGLYRLFGLPDAGGWIAQVVVASLATAAGITLLPVLGQRLGLHAASGWMAAVFLAVSPINLWVESWGGWEQPFAVLVLFSLLLVFCAFHDHGSDARSQPAGLDEVSGVEAVRPGRLRLVFLLIAAGLLIGISALLSPSLLPAAALMVLAELLTQVRRRRFVLAAAAAMAVIALICIAPWTYRNYQVLGGFVPIRSNFGLELWIGNNPQANGKTFVTYFDDPHRITRQWHPAGSATQRAHLQSIGERAYMLEKQRQALEWIGSHPGTFALLTINRFQYFWFPGNDMWSPSAFLRTVRGPLFCLAGVAAFAGLLYLLLRRHGSRWLVAAAVFGPSLVYMITHVEMRYRYPTFALSILLGCHLVLEGAMWLGRQFPHSRYLRWGMRVVPQPSAFRPG